jgi:antibiotic biosynthesis monooxygenase (ABM) superfamily enzyme
MTKTATDRAITFKSSVEVISHATFTPQKICRVYMQTWKSYKTWVDSTDRVACTQNGKYLTRENVDKFFLLQLQYKDHIHPKNLGQFKNSLETYSRNVEYPLPMTPLLHCGLPKPTAGA